MDRNKAVGTLLILTGLGLILVPFVLAEGYYARAGFLGSLRHMKLVLVEKGPEPPLFSGFYIDEDCARQRGKYKKPAKISWEIEDMFAERNNVAVECVRIGPAPRPRAEVSIPYPLFLALGIMTTLAGVALAVGALPLRGGGSQSPP